MRISKVKATDGRTITEMAPENDDDVDRLDQMLESGQLKPNAEPTPAGRRGKCPQCGSRSVARIAFGIPVWTPELEQDEKAGRIVLGGCCVTGDDPNRHCNHCGYEWRSTRKKAVGCGDNRPLLDALLHSGVIRLERAAFLSEAPPRIPSPVDLDRVEGMLLGLAIGDALGNTTEGMGPGERRAAYGEITNYLPNRDAGGRRVGTPTDDSQMAFWTLELLLADGGLVPEHLAGCFSRREIFGIGKSVREFRARFREGRPWEEAGVPSAGNGAVMRIAPVLVPHLLAPSPAVWADAALAGMVTHNGRTSNACCVAIAALLWSALGFEAAPAPGWWLERFVAVAGPLEGDTELIPRCDRHRGSYRGSLTGFVSTRVRDALDAGRSVREVSDEFWSAAFLLETIPSVFAILQRHADSPREAILRAVNDTWDNDTVAAIVGAVVGALHGRKALPQEWIDGLLGRTGAEDDGRVFELIAETKRFLRGPAGVRGKRVDGGRASDAVHRCARVWDGRSNGWQQEAGLGSCSSGSRSVAGLRMGNRDLSACAGASPEPLHGGRQLILELRGLPSAGLAA